jgi:hypothetical protein
VHHGSLEWEIRAIRSPRSVSRIRAEKALPGGTIASARKAGDLTRGLQIPILFSIAPAGRLIKYKPFSVRRKIAPVLASVSSSRTCFTSRTRPGFRKFARRVQVRRTLASNTTWVSHIKDGDARTLVLLDVKQRGAIGPIL